MAPYQRQLVRKLGGEIAGGELVRDGATVCVLLKKADSLEDVGHQLGAEQRVGALFGIQGNRNERARFRGTGKGGSTAVSNTVGLQTGLLIKLVTEGPEKLQHILLVRLVHVLFVLPFHSLQQLGSSFDVQLETRPSQVKVKG